MCKALDDHEGNVSIGGQLITNFRFADDIVVNAEEEEAAGVLVDHLNTTTGTKWRLVQREIKIEGQRLEKVENFKYSQPSL